MKKLFVMLFIGFIFKGLHSQETMPCCAPPFISNVVKPNVLLVLDVTGSMRWRAIWDGTYSQDQWGNWYCDPAYDHNKTYYGYFHPDSVYRYGQGNAWHAVGYDASHTVFDMSSTSHPRISGNILNWGVMSRMDVAKKALAGGKGVPGNLYNKNTLIGEGDGGSGSWAGWRTWPIQGIDGQWYCFDKPRYYSNNPEEFYIYRLNSWHSWSFVDDYECRIDVRNVPDELKIGVIGQIADKNLDGNWDPEAPRFGLLIFSTWQFDLEFQLYQSEDDPDMEPLFNHINDIDPRGGTQVGDAVFEAIHYIRYCQSHYGTYTWHGYGTKWDPYMNFRGNVVTDTVWCRKNFVLIIGDGESNSDHRVTTDGHLPSVLRDLCNYFDYDDEPGHQYDCSDGSGDTDDPADDYAYYGHITDLRPDNVSSPEKLECPQTIDFFGLFAFGQGSQLFKDLSALGGFEDKNGNLIPDGYYTNGSTPSDPYDEWDQNDDGIPDNYYEAQNGQELETAIKSILSRILAGATSASQASVVSQTSKGEGIGTFALFYPRKNIGAGRFISWLGEIKGIWVDRFGLLREETEGNLSLDLNNDYVINFESPDTVNQCDPQNVVYVYRYRDTSCTGENLEFVDQITLDQLQPLWDGGNLLWNISPDERVIYTGIDQDNNNVVRASENEIIEFTTSNLSQIDSFLDVYSSAFADTLIRYIRGYDFPHLRHRTIDGKVWKLGDIIYSSPMFVQEPMERYDLLYLDTEYKNFYEVYQDRRGVVYVGANDGMIHAFNVGRYIEDSETGCEPGHVDPMGLPIGSEIWAYLPFNLLPHLKWLSDPDYCHVYYVDLKPYPTDVKIFKPPDPKHIGGFGTVLIGSARLGGQTYNLGADTLSSSYFCIDVTKPKDPVVLWERALPDDSSFTTPYPNVVKVGDEWFLVIGSGPELCSGFSDKNAKVYILNLRTGNIAKTFTVPETNSAIGDIISVDIGLDYTVDAIYFGTYYYTGNQNDPNWQGKVYRIKTHGNENPDNWDLTLLIDLGKPITAPGAATMDEYGNLWVYFGSGRLFYDGDEADKEEQIFLGIKDDTSSIYTLNDLVDVTDYHVYGDSVQTGTGTTISWEELVGNIRNADGWYRRFNNPLGERCLSRPLVIGGAVIFTSYNPRADICSFGGEGRLYALYYLTGTAYKKPILGEIGGESLVSVNLGGGMPSEPSMWIGSSEEKAFIQIGGEIKDVTPVLPLNPRGGLILWKGR